MEQFNYLYKQNKLLDDIFNELYDNYSKETIEKNIVELLVELGELANETRCFKYWSNKKPSDREDILEEYADCFIMGLCFCNIANIELNESFIEVNNKNIIYQFKELFKLSSQLDSSLNKDLVKEILSNLHNLGKLLDFTDKDIIEGSLKKINKNLKRFETGF